jgi:hypothetical protein
MQENIEITPKIIQEVSNLNFNDINDISNYVNNNLALTQYISVFAIYENIKEKSNNFTNISNLDTNEKIALKKLYDIKRILNKLEEDIVYRPAYSDVDSTQEQMQNQDTDIKIEEIEEIEEENENNVEEYNNKIKEIEEEIIKLKVNYLSERKKIEKKIIEKIKQKPDMDKKKIKSFYDKELEIIKKQTLLVAKEKLEKEGIEKEMQQKILNNILNLE